MSSYQVFRNTLLQLGKNYLFFLNVRFIMVFFRVGSSKWTDMPPSVAQIDPSFVGDLVTVFPVVFSDASGFLNYCYQMSPAVYDRVKFDLAIELVVN